MGEYTTGCDDNLLGITDKELLNEEEAKGVMFAFESLLDMEDDQPVDIAFFLNIHATAFSRIYDWAGKRRRSNPNVGSYTPPHYSKVPMLMAQFVEELNYRIANCKSEADLVKLLAYAHHKIVHIHPFTNGNGRTARLVTDFIALQKGYQPINLYERRQSDARESYLKAIKAADDYDYSLLEDKIRPQIISLQ